jgi:hypothetical protein
MPETEIPTVSVTTKNTVSLTLGIVAIVIGVVALLIGWVPFLGLFAIPAAVIGFILAGVGVLVALLKKGKGAGLPIVGALICIAALILPILSTGSASAAFSHALTDARNKQTEKENANITVISKGETAINPSNSASASPNPFAAPAEPEPPKVVWNNAANALRVGDIQVEIKELKIGPVDTKDMFGESGVSKDSLLAITIAVTNLSTGKKLDFKTWRGAQFDFGGSAAKLTDDNENAYRRISFGSTTKVVGGVENESIYPAQGLTDMLIFEKPVDTVKWLRLALPAENIKREGTIRFEIPETMIRR